MEARQVGAIPIFFIFIVSLCLVPWVGEAATIAVNCPTDSLQAAVDGASGGDVIEASGTCNENVLIVNGKTGITLDGQGIATVNGADTAATIAVLGRGIAIKRFTIFGGSNGIALDRGGTAVIDNNVITSAVETNPRRGAGIVVTNNSFGRIVNNMIENNQRFGIAVVDSSAAYIGFLSRDDTTASPNTIRNNGTAGIRVVYTSSADIAGNDISNNVGNGIEVFGVSHAEIDDNTINGNSGDGINVSQNSGVQLGQDAGSSIFFSPNITTVNNGGFGIQCSIGGYADGRRGTLDGASGKRRFGTGCINSLIP